MAEDWHKAAIAGNTEAMARQLADGKRVDALDGYGQTVDYRESLDGRHPTGDDLPEDVTPPRRRIAAEE